MLHGLSLTIPGAVAFKEYQPCKHLFLYGWGGDEQQAALRKHGGSYACFDLGYWSREVNRHWRVSVDGWHCPDRMMTGAGPERLGRYGFKIHKANYNPDGPILLVGNSMKTCKVAGRNWSRRKAAWLRRRTDRPIWYKTKPRRSPEPGVDADEVVSGDIADVLPQVSMVVCRHSNVAVDAAFYGVPVVCEDGAGAAIYPKTLDGPQPSYEQRVQFLRDVAWWQWSTDEIKRGECWKWLRGQLED
jgi:hypothetical protein